MLSYQGGRNIWQAQGLWSSGPGSGRIGRRGTQSSADFRGRCRLFFLSFIQLLLFPLLISCQQKLPNDLPNNSMFGKNVYVFDEHMDSADIQNVLDHVHIQHAGKEFLNSTHKCNSSLLG